MKNLPILENIEPNSLYNLHANFYVLLTALSYLWWFSLLFALADREGVWGCYSWMVGRGGPVIPAALLVLCLWSWHLSGTIANTREEAVLILSKETARAVLLLALLEPSCEWEKVVSWGQSQLFGGMAWYLCTSRKHASSSWRTYMGGCIAL